MTGERLHVPAGSVATATLRGDVFRFLLTADDTGGGYSVTRVDVPVGGGPWPHTHEGAQEWFYVLEGSASFHVARRVVDAAAGDLVHIPRGTEHWFEVPAEPVRFAVRLRAGRRGAGLARVDDTRLRVMSSRSLRSVP